jgi:hypothetical protein
MAFSVMGVNVLTGRDTLDTTTARETADGGLGNTLDVVLQNLAVALGTTLAEALAALAAYVVSVALFEAALRAGWGRVLLSSKTDDKQRVGGVW